MLEDIALALQWWGMLFALGILSYPLIASLFPSFVDRGYGLAKIGGMIALSYAVFVLGTLHLVPFNLGGLFLSLFLTFGISFFLLLKFRPKRLSTDFLPFLKTHWRLLLFEELLFLLVFAFWTFVRAHQPGINGLEKYMDYGFINTVLRSDYFPANDMWLTPLSINYYYFGHLVTAVLTKLSFLPSAITYNLMLATLAGLCFTASFSIGATLLSISKSLNKSLKPIITGGLLIALLVTFSGNIHPIYSLFEAYPNEEPVPMWELAFTPQSFPNSYWYPNATRFIYNTIHEFPIYSWVVADLHGHVLDIPFVLFTIAFLLSFFLNFQKRSSFTAKTSSHHLLRKLSLFSWQYTASLVFISFLLSILYMTNAWDGIIYLLLSGLILLSITWQSLTHKATLSSLLVSFIKRLIAPVLILGLGFFLFSLPFSLFFKPFVSGIGILCAPEFLINIGQIGPFLFEADHCQRSPLWQLWILHGFFYLLVTLFLIFLWKTKKIFISDVFVLCLILLSTLLIAIPEFAYMKDIYPAHYRANTMFKLVFQSFIMLSLSSGYIILRLSQALKNHPRRLILHPLFLLALTPFLMAIFIYPYFAISSYYGELKTYHGLNGISYLENRYPNDYEAILWLQENVTGQPVVLEAQGDSYTDYARVSANTGLPTVLGWTVHEWLWRGSYDIPSPRIEEVKTLYESDDIEATRDLLEKYDVEYVFLGELEREKYPDLNVEKFEELGEVVFEEGLTKIIQLNLSKVKSLTQ